MKVSLIQFDINELDVEKNFAKVLYWLKKSLVNSPDVIVLPEMWNSAYALKHLDVVSDYNGQKTKKLISNFAFKNSVNIVAGSVVTEKNGYFFNTTYVFNRKGSLINEYDKVHLFSGMDEEKWLKSGNSYSNFSIDNIPSTSIICYDTRFPEWIRKLVTKNLSQIIFIPAQWPSCRGFQWETLLKARAIENQAFVIAVNRIGKSGNNVFSGLSFVINPLGEVLFKGKNQEGTFTVEINLEMVTKIRQKNLIFNDLKDNLY